MSTAAPQAETRVLLSNVAWSTFEDLAARGGGTRLTYDRGYLEIMSPSFEHERIKKLIARMIEWMAVELEIPMLCAGSITLKGKLKRRGLEPDECYYIASEPAIRGRDQIDLTVDPPPDLAVEVDVSSSSLDQLAIYGELGVPEVWIVADTTLRFHHLQPDSTYRPQSQSRTFPFVSADDLQGMLDRYRAMDDATWFREFRQWVRSLRA